MAYKDAEKVLMAGYGAEPSTMMNSPCLRYKGEFIGMMFDKEDALIIKVAETRVKELIEQGVGREFNFTKKRFKEWVLIPLERENEFEGFLVEALEFAKTKV
ncbi:hypothetical protein [Teredinibacter franksiae]|uniref:hypothetical protein n=1 Tax=Teredinibacter franksiae TaxID=2761453 RepID=UPI0016299DDC|nr:hypothetical protein [Teredinibacter franksiae]